MKLIRDVGIVIISIFVAIILVRLQILDAVLSAARSTQLLGVFVSGLFFTSAFTTPLSIVALGELSLTVPVWTVAVIGALGAMIGDLIIFTFIRDTFQEDIEEYLKIHPHRKIQHFFRKRMFRWLTPCIGALIIASPLPDELGLALMGMSRMKRRDLIVISFLFNFFGILLIAGLARAL